MGSAALELCILGPLVARRHGTPVDLGPRRQRAVLALLAIHAGTVVSVDRLIDQLWAGEPPASAHGTLQAYISNLRRALEPDRPARVPPAVLVTEAPGYALRLDADQLDALRFEGALRHARAADVRPVDALGAVTEALALWRGPALAEFEHEDFAAAWCARFDELRAGAVELHADLLLELGRAGDAVAELGPAIAQWPLREHLRARQVLALGRCGRQAEALRAYDDARRLLLDELGLVPGPELEAAYRLVLDGGAPTTPPSTAAGAGPAPAPAATPPAPAPAELFVGRDDQLVRVLGWPRPGFVIVSGEAGIGKTRLAEEVLAKAAHAGQRVASGRCHDDEGAPPLWPWRQVADGLGIAEQAGFSDDGGPEGDLFVRFQQITVALRDLAATAPVTVVLDDLQWADRSTLRLLGFLATEVRDAPVLVVVTVRDTDVTPGSPAADTLARLARARTLHLTLDGLGLDDVAAVVRAATGSEPEQPALARLVERTGGNPFFVSQVARLWAGADADGHVPELVGDVVRARLARLPVPSRSLLLTAAALGRSFDVGLLTIVAGVPVPSVLDGLDAAVATRLLVDEPPGRMRFVHALVAETLMADAGATRVGHLHLRAAEVLAAARTEDPAISASEVARQLDRVVAALGPAHAARASAAAAEASREATGGGAFADAAAWAEAALRHARTADLDVATQVRLLTTLAVARFDSGERTGPGSAAEAQHEAIALASRLPGDRRALALAECATIALRRPRTWQWRPTDQIDEHVVTALEDALVGLEAGDVVARVRVLASLAIEVVSTSDGPRRGEELTAEAVELARTVDDVELLAAALLARALVLDVPGGRPAQRLLVDEVLALRSRGLPRDLAAVALIWRLGLRVAMAEGPAVEDPTLAELRGLIDELQDPVLGVTLDWWHVTLAYFRADWDAAHDRAVAAYRRQQAVGEFSAATVLLAHEGLRLRELGLLPKHHSEVLPPPPDESDRQGLRSFALGVASAAGDVELTRRTVDAVAPIVVPRRDQRWMIRVARLLEAATVGGSPWLDELYEQLLPFEGEVLLLWPHPVHGAVDLYLGLGARAAGRPAAAVAHLRRAMALHERIGAVPWRCRAAVELVEALLDAGSTGEARQLLDRIAPDLDRFGLVDLAKRVPALAGRAG